MELYYLASCCSRVKMAKAPGSGMPVRSAVWYMAWSHLTYKNKKKAQIVTSRI